MVAGDAVFPATATKTPKIMTGIELIAKERQEQIEKHGRTVEHDDLYNYNGQLAWAAAHLLAKDFSEQLDDCCPDGWSQEIWDKMMGKSKVERLAIAGALIAAELDRISMQESEVSHV